MITVFNCCQLQFSCSDWKGQKIEDYYSFEVTSCDLKRIHAPQNAVFGQNILFKMNI